MEKTANTEVKPLDEAEGDVEFPGIDTVLSDKLRASHGDVFVMKFKEQRRLGDNSTPAPTYVFFRAPRNAEAESVIDRASNSKNKAALFRVFASQVVVHPSGKEWDALLERRGGYASAIANAAIDIWRGDETENVKKL